MANAQLQDATKDSDGIPPGLEVEWINKKKIIRFTGIFYAQPELGSIVLRRPVQIIFASKEIFVAIDLELGNLYVVDRAKRLSLGCRMTADLEPMPTIPAA